MAEVFDWDIIAANNNDAPPNGAPENMEYSEVNDTMREFMAVLARFYATSLSGTKASAGSTTAYTLVSGQTISDYAPGQMFTFAAHGTSTGAVTLNVDGLGAAAIVDSRGNQLTTGDIRSGGVYTVLRMASNFRVLGHLAALSIQASGSTLTQAFLATGTGNAITLTTGLLTAYANGQLLAFRAAAANTTAVTINIDGLGAEALEDWRSAALASGDIQADRIYFIGRTAGEWRILTSLAVDLANEVIGVLPIANGGTASATAQAAVETIFTALTAVTPATGDTIAFMDASDGDNGKKATLGAMIAALSLSGVALQVFTATGTYTPNALMKQCLVISTGAGGGGGGADTTDASATAGGGGGGAGATCIELFSAATIGVSQAVTIGAAGTAGTNAGSDGGAGGNTTFGALHTAGGGSGGLGAIKGVGGGNDGAPGGTGSGGTLNIAGGGGGSGYGSPSGIEAFGGAGGSSFWGGGGRGVNSGATATGIAGAAYGSGGSGGANTNDTAGITGGAGAPGVCLVLEFLG